MHLRNRPLMLRQYHCIGNDDVFATTSREDDDLGDIIARERLAVTGVEMSDQIMYIHITS